jgi:hypothetical protein
MQAQDTVAFSELFLVTTLLHLENLSIQAPPQNILLSYMYYLRDDPEDAEDGLGCANKYNYIRTCIGMISDAL